MPKSLSPPARNADRGQDAVKQLQQEGLSPEFLALDVSNLQSIISAKEQVEKEYGRLDVLINNAGVLFRVITIAQCKHKLILSLVKSVSRNK